MTSATRHRLLPGREGAAIRDIDNAQRTQVPLQLIEFTDIYAEPMTLKLDHAPKAILLARVQEVDLPETPIDTLAAVSFTAIATGARIDMMFGLEVGVRYRYTLLVIG